MTAKLLRCLLDGDSTVKEMMAASGYTDSGVRHWLGPLREAGVIRVAFIEPVSRVRVYGFNPEGLRDFTRRKQTKAERSARYRQRKLAAMLMATALEAA